jgi:elongation factor P--beta-lysine ligase
MCTHKINVGDPKVCEKVEIYMAGKELGNGYTELLDAEEQRRGLMKSRKLEKN